jgi:D-alanyl-lipoteichoic acid acyltransferase DltB (MBOAT superfamily)
LGGSRVSKGKVVRNTFIIFLVSGFWHGANWTFITWGAYHAVLFLPLIWLGKNRKFTTTIAEGSFFPSIKESVQMGITFGLVVFGWILFRAENMNQAWDYISKIFSFSLFTIPQIEITRTIMTLFLITVFMAIEWIGRKRQYAIEDLSFVKSRYLRWSFYYALTLLIFCFSGDEQQFIYFQF